MKLYTISILLVCEVYSMIFNQIVVTALGNKYTQGLYSYTADQLLTMKFSAGNFKDLKRKHRVVFEFNRRISNCWKESMKDADNLLSLIFQDNAQVSKINNYGFPIQVPLDLAKIAKNIVEQLIEGIPPLEPIDYISTETLGSIYSQELKQSHGVISKNLKTILTRAACRLLLGAVIFSSYEQNNLNITETKITRTSPYLDDINIKPKTTIKQNIVKSLTTFWNSVKGLGPKFKKGIFKLLRFETDEMPEITEEVITRFKSEIQSYNTKIYGDPLYSDRFKLGSEISLDSVLKLFFAKQEHNALNLISELQNFLDSMLNINNQREGILLDVDSYHLPQPEDIPDHMKSEDGLSTILQMKILDRIPSLCSDMTILALLPNTLKFKSCVYFLEIIIKFLNGYFYLKQRCKEGSIDRKNVTKQIRYRSALRFTQGILTYYNQKHINFRESLYKTSKSLRTNQY
ncbi:uncharacterized protein CMU_036170 [Cryptosporidium muris RN66]|uniref:Uncharacterized protein n=1 Tax=Cryptosporidium muris (strain RN66) TaxID=441375 RepID=B6AGV3_CRYMR|nr:uncharacterized protein CMU_036170 [Cryptosporidium muris RN66]EEA07444.1 hypothetical protein CMU_036170 [Cryptosporidium muris RN66]|eukprot:XP_002141793.1 hypothetical protein [Cryptosporidium muris RN66]